MPPVSFRRRRAGRAKGHHVRILDVSTARVRRHDMPRELRRF